MKRDALVKALRDARDALMSVEIAKPEGDAQHQWAQAVHHADEALAQVDKPKTWNCVVLHFGYVEFSLTSPLILTNKAMRFDSPAALLKNLAQWFFEKWLLNTGYSEGKDCCAKALKASSKAKARKPKFCSECGGSLNVGDKFSTDDYVSWLFDLQGSTAESFGEDPEDSLWFPWPPFRDVLTGEGVVEVSEAEKVLTFAIDPSVVTKGVALALEGYRRTYIEMHCQNRVAGKNLGVDELIAFEARDAMDGDE
jgi:hypothetical protein